MLVRRIFGLTLLATAAGVAQHEHDMGSMDRKPMSRTATFLMLESTGTAFQPPAWPMPMVMTRTGDWHLMWMAQAFAVDTQQSGPRGADKFYSVNWGMLSAIHDFGGGAIMLRSMLSLDPATVTDRRYPLLFQSGETAYGRPLVDAQHPHDFVMDLSIQYAHRVGERGTWNVYYAPIGDPALGPVAYPHRASAMETPQAALGHHWMDSTHIASNVLTAGVSYGKFRVEASGFHGREPDENRWNIDWGKMDSWATRVSYSPNRRWTGQFSVGRLTSPESTHPGDVLRTTASAQYIRRAAHNTWLATTIAWGQNNKLDEHRRTNAFLAEAVVPFSARNYITARYEWSQRDELLEHDERAYPVNAYTAGYTRDIGSYRMLRAGAGANVTAYGIDPVLKAHYGDHPWGVSVFLRFRLQHP